MIALLLGLALFLGTHSVRIFAEDFRGRQIAHRGLLQWKGLYSLVSLAGLVLIIWGYGLSREEAVVLWNPPLWTRHLAALVTLPAFVLLVAAYVPGNEFAMRLRHPMILGVKAWALAHLIANGRLGDVVLFGSFLLWAILDFRAARQRDRTGQVPAVVRATPVGTGATIVIGLGLWVAFAFWLHVHLIGVAPFG